MSVISGAGAPSGRTGSVDDGGVPFRAAGVELIGEIPGSGYQEPPALVRRADGQTIQLTKLLYLVLGAVDGRRTYDEIADVVSPAFGQLVSADDVHMLCDTKLRTLGVLQLADGSQPEVKRSNPLLALKFRYVVSDPAVTRRVTAPFAWLFNPFVVAPVVLGFVAVCAWVLLEKGLASATHQAFDEPGLLLVVIAVTVVSAGFHEFGHAAAARYGGATPGAMGVGLYLVWPAFYTDVTDCYRLGRGGRVRTDLGGLYFNAIVAVAMFGVWWVSGWDAILLIIATQMLQMVRQLAPLVRFDGYHVLADVIGVPDLYHRIKPTLLGLLPGRWNDSASKVLRPWARAVVTTWVVVVVPLLLGCLVLMVLALPRLLGTAMAGLDRQWQMMGEQVAAGDVLSVMVRVLSIVAIVLPVLGVGYILTRVVRQTVTVTWRVTGGRPARRAVAGLAAVAIVATLLWAWWPQPGTYRPIQAYERGTLQDAVPTVLAPRTSKGLQGGYGGTAQTVWLGGSRLPTADSPQLALVLVPRIGAADPAATGGGDAAATASDSAAATGAGDPPATAPDSATSAGVDQAPAPTWVFPFGRPAAPEVGDNQALAVNTEDGSTVYDVAFALVWVTGDSVRNTNEAYAFASCTDCRTVAIGFQVVLVLGQANVVVPQNVSAAVNYSCVVCVTYALATQLVITLSGPLSDQGNADLAALWAEIAEFGASIQGVPLSELQSRLTTYERRILDIVRTDPSATPAGDSEAPGGAPSSAPTGTVSPSGSGTGTSTGTVATPGTGSATVNPTSEPTSSPAASTTTEEPRPPTTAAPSATTSPEVTP